MDKIRLSVVVVAGMLLAGVARQGAAQRDTTAAHDSLIAAQLEQLDQKVRVLARILELKQDSATAAAKQPQPRVGAGREGFVIKSADGAFQFKLRAYVQADGRFFPGTAPATLG